MEPAEVQKQHGKDQRVCSAITIWEQTQNSALPPAGIDPSGIFIAIGRAAKTSEGRNPKGGE